MDAGENCSGYLGEGDGYEDLDDVVDLVLCKELVLPGGSSIEIYSTMIFDGSTWQN